jgi:hypothetical protein
VTLDVQAASPQAEVKVEDEGHRRAPAAPAHAIALGDVRYQGHRPDDALAGLLQRAVARRGQNVLARALSPLPSDKADKDYIGQYVVRHVPNETDEKLLKITGVIRTGQTVTSLQIERAPNSGESDVVPINDPGYAWAAQRKASRRAWLKTQQQPAQPQPAQGLPAQGQPAQGQPAQLTVRAGNTLTAPKTLPQAEADKHLTLPPGAPPITDTDTVWRLDARLIRYTQDSIDYKFSTQTPGGARNVNDAVDTLIDDKDKFSAMPTLRVVLTHKGLIRSLDNRRVWVAKRAWPAGDPPVRWAKRSEYTSEAFKWTGDGKSIAVRNVPVGVKLKQPPPRQ